MRVIRLELPVAEEVADALREARFEVLVAVDDLDGAFKIKIDGGTWSPPMGEDMTGPVTRPF